MAADTTTQIPALDRPPAALRAGTRGTRRLGLALVVISMAQLMLVLDELIVNTALPHIQRALHFSGTGLEWVVTGYAVTFGGLLMLGGRAGDILGRRRMLTGGILAFTAASLAGGLATTSWLLITARVLQGAGAAAAAPAALSLITVTFPEGRLRTRALGVYAAMTGMGGGVGALAGFVAIEARSAQPLLPLWIFADRNRAGVYVILLCLASVFFAMFFFLTLFTQVVWGYSALRGGLAYLPFIGGFIAAAGICTKLVTRFGARVPMTTGAVLAPVALFW